MGKQRSNWFLYFYKCLPQIGFEYAFFTSCVVALACVGATQFLPFSFLQSTLCMIDIGVWGGCVCCRGAHFCSASRIALERLSGEGAPLNGPYQRRSTLKVDPVLQTHNNNPLSYICKVFGANWFLELCSSHCVGLFCVSWCHAFSIFICGKHALEDWTWCVQGNKKKLQFPPTHLNKNNYNNHWVWGPPVKLKHLTWWLGLCNSP